MNYEKMSIEELEKLKQGLRAEQLKIKDEMRKIARVLDSRTVEREAKKKVEGMSNAEKDALRQVLSPKGIESEESVTKF